MPTNENETLLERYAREAAIDEVIESRPMGEFRKWWMLLSKIVYRSKEEIAELAFEHGRSVERRALLMRPSDELDELKYDRSTRIEFAARVLEDHDMLEAADRLRSLITPNPQDSP